MMPVTSGRSLGALHQGVDVAVDVHVDGVGAAGGQRAADERDERPGRAAASRRSARTIVGTVVISSSSMMRGLVERDVGADDRARRARRAVGPVQHAARRQPGRDEGSAADGHSDAASVTSAAAERRAAIRRALRCAATVVEWSRARSRPCSTSPRWTRHVVEDRPWVVIVWNDPINLMSYVTFVLQKLFGYDLEKATALMLDVHHKGKAVVASGIREQSELHVFRLHEHGLWATLEHDE